MLEASSRFGIRPSLQLGHCAVAAGDQLQGDDLAPVFSLVLDVYPSLISPVDLEVQNARLKPSDWKGLRWVRTRWANFTSISRAMDGFRSIYPARREVARSMTRSPNNCAPVRFYLLELSLIPLSDYLFMPSYSLLTGKASTEDQIGTSPCSSISPRHRIIPIQARVRFILVR